MKVTTTSKYVQAPAWLHRWLTKRGYAQVTVTETAERTFDCHWCDNPATGQAWWNPDEPPFHSCGECGDVFEAD